MKKHPHNEFLADAVAYGVSVCQHEYSQLVATYGQINGTKMIKKLIPIMMEFLIAEYLCYVVDENYCHGRENVHEKDIHHQTRKRLSLELRTCTAEGANAHVIKGSVNNGKHGPKKDRNSFYLFVSIGVDDKHPLLSLREVSCGFVMASDWTVLANRSHILRAKKQKLFTSLYSPIINTLQNR